MFFLEVKQCPVSMVCHDLCLRSGEDEVHVAAGGAEPEVEPLYYEAGAFPGSYPREQQCGRTQAEGMCAAGCFSQFF